MGMGGRRGGPGGYPPEYGNYSTPPENARPGGPYYGPPGGHDYGRPHFNDEEGLWEPRCLRNPE